MFIPAGSSRNRFVSAQFGFVRAARYNRNDRYCDIRRYTIKYSMSLRFLSRCRTNLSKDMRLESEIITFARKDFKRGGRWGVDFSSYTSIRPDIFYERSTYRFSFNRFHTSCLPPTHTLPPFYESYLGKSYQHRYSSHRFLLVEFRIHYRHSYDFPDE